MGSSWGVFGSAGLRGETDEELRGEADEGLRGETGEGSPVL
jgi:hypothetical protein